jgi:polyphosphate kinase 2 (PPK2 family)
MLDKTNTAGNPWKIIKSDSKKSSRLESIKYVLSLFEFSSNNLKK